MKDVLQNIKWRSICPISSALDIVGDKWSLLILRDLIMKGNCTFSQFLEAPENISTNILSDRLVKLKKYGLVYRPEGTSNRNNPYQLTESGKDFELIIYSLGCWASKHLGEANKDMVLIPNIEDYKSIKDMS